MTNTTKKMGSIVKTKCEITNTKMNDDDGDLPWRVLLMAIDRGRKYLCDIYII
jgi:hypothetical protein